jgi:hypothetical protein
LGSLKKLSIWKKDIKNKMEFCKFTLVPFIRIRASSIYIIPFTFAFFLST